MDNLRANKTVEIIEQLAYFLNNPSDTRLQRLETRLIQYQGIYQHLDQEKNATQCTDSNSQNEAQQGRMMDEYGAYYKVQDGVLYQLPRGEEEWIEVTAPQVAGEEAGQEFIQDINKHFGTQYKLEDFSGR